MLVAATAGTARHSLVLEHALRPLFAYLHAVVVPTGVFAATEDFAGGPELAKRVDRAAAELAALLAVGGGTPSPAPHRTVEDEFADPTSVRDAAQAGLGGAAGVLTGRGFLRLPM